jgi:hypothetical protein
MDMVQLLTPMLLAMGGMAMILFYILLKETNENRNRKNNN